MFTKITPTADSQLSNADVANLIVSDTIEKIATLTGLTHQDAFTLLAEQVNQHCTGISHKNITKAQKPLLEHSESQFISNLFN